MYENIKDLSEIKYDAFSNYFLDANVWLAYIDSGESFTSKTFRDYKVYIDFVENIIADNISNKENAPKIVMTSLLLSEIMNRYMHDTAMKKYCTKFKLNYKDMNFKTDYRPTEHYKQQLSHLLNALQRFETCFWLLPDNLEELSFFENLPAFQDQEKDFNDFYFYQLAKKYDFPIVTHDGDFVDQDIVIITQNSKTLEKKAMFSSSKKNVK